MNRYKLKKSDFPAAIKYILGKAKKGESPNWAVKFKDDLTVKGSKLKFKGMDLIPEADADAYLRKVLMDPQGDVPFSRDAAFHILKNRVAGIGRRKIMEFFRKQRTLGETRPALPKPKVKGGEKLKKLTIETDLIFIRKNDLVASNPRFRKDEDLKFESYIVSTVEKTSGLSRLDYVTTKKAAVVTPVVKRHIREIAAALGVAPKNMTARMDKGGEFSVKELKKLVPDTYTVAMGSSVEARNRMAQQSFYRILKNRRSLTIKGALTQTQKLLNQSLNRIQKATPNESVAKKATQKELLTQYNRTRATHVAGDSRKEFQVGDWVRIQVKKPKAGIDYKSYKNQTFTEVVYKISKRTQGKRRGQPIKYRVNKKWFTQDLLLKSAPRDQETERIIEERDEKQDDAEEKAEAKRQKEEKEKEAALKIYRENLEKAGVKRKTRKQKRVNYRDQTDAEFERMLQGEGEDTDDEKLPVPPPRKKKPAPRRKKVKKKAPAKKKAPEQKAPEQKAPEKKAPAKKAPARRRRKKKAPDPNFKPRRSSRLAAKHS